MKTDHLYRRMPAALRRVLIAVAVIAWLGGGAGHTAAAADGDKTDAVIITDMAAWHHPVQAVFAKYKVHLVKVELLHDRKYPVFHVALAGWPEPRVQDNDHFYAGLLSDLLKANANWPYKVQCDEDNSGFEVKWDAQRKQPTWDLIALPG